ncbi:hypothetical protein IKE_05869 [Bacillus cereus VD196]|uniref:Uncharacterized protein n=1 Tax=Bacillus cereus VD196 TaxID=1053243 RepID=A0A9W5PYG1_BACCE|nr:hypothetical protein [Bacillus cereus]EJR93377.1 hypothetical protein IKG_05493 [Bacillus cereus VD200]EOO61595.1 hypothetical protein IKE_05869 [Bacillus cereus VD196]
MYSKYDVMHKELQLMSATTWWERAKIEWTLKDKYRFEIKMLKIYLFRMKIIIEDMEEDDYECNASDLAEILVEDFLEHIRSKNSMEQLYQILENKKHFADIELKFDENEERYGTIAVKIDRKTLRRIEVFFSDMAHTFPLHGYTADRLINILMCDYMKYYAEEPGQKLSLLKRRFL